MRFRFLHRCLTVCLMAGSMLFAQLALAAYTCPGAGAAAAMSPAMAVGVPCEGMDPAQPMLCHQHGTAATTHGVTGLDMPSPYLPAIVQVVVIPLLPDVHRAPLPPAAAAVAARPPPDPLFLSTLRLRV